MAELILMPQKGLTEESAILSYWHVKKGDVVKEGDYLFDIETGKATFSIESEVAGTVLETIGAEGDEILVKSVVCVIGKPGESYDIPGRAPAAAPAASAVSASAGKSVSEPVAAAQVPMVAPVRTPVVVPSPAAESGASDRLFASPKARALAVEKGIDLALVIPTGPNGRITRDDVLRAAAGEIAIRPSTLPVPAADHALATAKTGAVAPVAAITTSSAASAASADGDDCTVVKNSTIRKVIARNMHQSLQSMAQLTLHAFFDATSLLEVKDRIKIRSEAQGRPGITINDMIVHAVSRTILDFPALNAHYNDETTTLFHNAHIGVAVDTKAGLMVPTIFMANRLSLRQISETAKSLANECQEGRATPQMLSGATFTTTNLGALRVAAFTPVIAPPQTAILGIGCIDYKVKPRDGQFVHYPAIGLSLTFDHRAVDGAPAARFLKALCENLEDYVSLLAE